MNIDMTMSAAGSDSTTSMTMKADIHLVASYK